MRCDKVKELLMEYVDNELNQNIQKEVSEHLGTCRECAKLEEELRRTVIEPLKNAEKLTTPEAVWQAVKTRIEASQSSIRLPELLKGLPEFFRVRRPALVVATVCVLFAAVFAGIHMRGQYTVSTYIEEQANFLSYLGEENGQEYEGINGINGIDLGTNIEIYLL